ncbi:putative morphogenesis protein [Janthinobacterium phage vB_JliS-Donnerlittchen]|uniref:NAD(+)--protein-arginine ADP-ribosyltransferase n=1 Tax=Janthinobacterium phage vB_JliS-Donnerlittchen TaxID=2948610 RepID=A0A9E7SJI4_9CAUD|nr:putative morphogenesis protein [Janthinobacterium phage vB_JliM-Donnerlittchen]USN14468.1 putative morphogenesis protein [Janthinobacterium phage vB_JliM-Donnerlittchen]
MAKTANEEVLDATVRHQIKLLRFSDGQAKAASALLAESDKELEALLRGGLTETSEARVRALLSEVRRLRSAMAEQLGEEMKPQLEGLASTEAEWEGAMLSSAIPVSLSLNSVPVSLLKAATGSPINGVPLTGWLGKMAVNDVSRIEQQVRLGVLAGETVDQMVQRIRGTKANGYKDGVLETTRREAEMIARTAVNHVSTAARQETWNANSDIIKGVRWVATLDGRTSPVCQSRDGQVYPINKGPRPPAHPNCRSTVAPVLDGEQIVGDRPTVTDKRTRAQREVDFRAEARDAAGDKWKGMSEPERRAAIKARRDKWADENIGQAPTSTNYQAWLKGQSKEFQDDVLGRGKADLFRKGVPLDKFVDEQGKPYSLQQLRAELEGDKLYVTQPGVGLKAKALLQQGLSPQQVLDQIKAEYPDASTSLASVASYKSELNKAGALSLPDAGKVPTGALKQAKAVADVVADLDSSLPANVKHAVGGQWSTVVDELQGSPGAYGYYQAGKGVLLSGKKLSVLPAAQAKQVAAHELGHLLHKQHELQLPDDVLAAVKAAAKGLPPDARKLYSYYLSSPDELVAELYAQALSPSPMTSQGLSALDFNKAFGPAVQASKKALADKFPAPPVGVPTPLQGGPSLPFEVAGKHTTVGSLAKALLQQGMPDEQVLKSVLAEFPEAKTKLASVQSYKSQLKKDGLLPNKAAAQVVSAKPLPDVVPVPPMPAAAVAAPEVVNVAPSAVKIAASELKAKGMELMKSGVMGNKDVVSSLEKLYPLNAGQVNASQVATWKSLWKKADPSGYAKAAGLSEQATAKASMSGPVAKPKLEGAAMGPTSSKALEKVKSVLAAGGTPADAYDAMKSVFGSIQEPGAADLLELAQYQLATAKAAGKPYLDAAFAVPKGVTLDAKLEKFVAALDAKGKAALDAYKEAKAKGLGVVNTNKLVKKKAGYEPSASAKVKLKEAADYELKKQGAVPKPAGVATATAAPQPTFSQVDMTPARPAATPREGFPPPPRFNSAQRAAGIRKIAGSVDTSTLSRMNALQKSRGLEQLTAEEAAAIRAYTGNTYRALNNALRSGKYATDHGLQAYVDAAQHGLGKMSKYRGLSSRGMTFNQDQLKTVLSTYRKGAVVEDAAFVSTSAGENAAFSGNVYLKVNGTSGVDIAQFSKYTGEREVLFMPGTRFRVDDVQSTGGKYIITVTEI